MRKRFSSSWRKWLPKIQKYFSAQVLRCQDDEKNIYLELVQSDNPKKKYLLLLRSVQVHLYEAIQESLPHFPVAMVALDSEEEN